MPEPYEVTDEMKQQALLEAEERKKAAKALKPGQPRNTPYVAAGISPEKAKQMLPNYVDIGPKPRGIGPKRWKWGWKRFKERRKLRRDLRKNYNIKKWTDFDEIAREVGLGLENPFLAWLLRGAGKLLTAGGLLSLAGAAALVMLGLFAWSFVSEAVGSFTIQLNPSTMRSGFVLSDTPGFEVKTARLFSTELEEVNAMTLEDITQTIDVEQDGSHNGDFYVAYTFYIMNDGDITQSYEWSLIMDDCTKNLDEALWLILYEDGHQMIYTKLSADGDPERLAGYTRPPFFDTAFAPEEQYYFYAKNGGSFVLDAEGTKMKFAQDAQGNITAKEGIMPTDETELSQFLDNIQNKWRKQWGINSTPMVDANIVAQGFMEDVHPLEKHKYTVVIYVEGNDPECTDALFGGFAKYHMQFDTVDDSKKGLFDTVYRHKFDYDEDEFQRIQNMYNGLDLDTEKEPETKAE